MATASQVSIANRALLGIGARAQISNFSPSDNSAEGDAVSVLFVPTFESLARAAHWNCLRKQAVLTLLQAAQGTPENPAGTSYPLPPVPWLYAYALPSDSLQMRFIVPYLPSAVGGTPPTSASIGGQSWIPGGGQIPYAVAYGTDSANNPIQVILTNQRLAQAVYTVNAQNPAIWDSLFQSAMVASLAAFLVPALSLSLPLMQMSIKNADSMIMQARVADGNEGVTVMDHVPDFIRARGGNGYCWGNNVSITPYGVYGGMCWPGAW